MKIAVIDIETSSLYPSKGQVLELGVFIDDLSIKVERNELEDYINTLPKFHCYIKYPNVIGEHYAVAMHNRIWQILATEKVVEYYDDTLKYCVLPEHKVYSNLAYFFKQHKVITNLNNSVVVAGKNVANFDIPFLKTLYGFSEMDNYSLFKFAHRTIDPAMLYIKINDMKPPSLDECLNRAGFEKTVNHTALSDAADVIRCLKMSSLYT